MITSLFAADPETETMIPLVFLGRGICKDLDVVLTSLVSNGGLALGKKKEDLCGLKGDEVVDLVALGQAELLLPLNKIDETKSLDENTPDELALLDFGAVAALEFCLLGEFDELVAGEGRDDGIVGLVPYPAGVCISSFLVGRVSLWRKLTPLEVGIERVEIFKCRIRIRLVLSELEVLTERRRERR